MSNIFVDQGEFSDPDFITGTHHRENAQFDNEIRYRVRRVKSNKAICKIMKWQRGIILHFLFHTGSRGSIG